MYVYKPINGLCSVLDQILFIHGKNVVSNHFLWGPPQITLPRAPQSLRPALLLVPLHRKQATEVVCILCIYIDYHPCSFTFNLYDPY